MNPTLRRLLILLTGLSTATGAFAASPTVAAPPMPAGKGVTPPIAAGFDAHLRSVAAKKVNLVGLKAVKAALPKGAGACATDACGEKLAKATKARFVLSGAVSNSDEIYTVELSVYDALLKKRTPASEVCELCAVEEVDGSITKAFAKLGKALSAKVPPKPKPVEPALIAVAIKSIPSGATVLLDGKKVGQTPITAKVKAGEHDLELVQAGFIPDTRKIAAVDKPVAIEVTMVADPNVGVPPAVDPELPEEPKPAMPVTTQVVPGIRHYSGAAIGMGIGGAILAGVGTWLIVLDGDITCDDGRGRSECPTVYNTKAVGLPAMGVGSALIGAAIAVAILDGADTTVPMPSVAPTNEGGTIFMLGGQF